jgi:methylated-DNA-[protein]-cysteine S-methyltransferase
VPCHRIIAAGGRLGGFSAAGGTDTKKRLLAHERATRPPADPAQGAFVF